MTQQILPAHFRRRADVTKRDAISCRALVNGSHAAGAIAVWWVAKAITVVGAAATIFAFRQRLRSARLEFAAIRPAISEDDFCRSVGATGTDAALWIEVRRAIAAQCHVPPESIGPTALLGTLSRLTLDGLDHLDLTFRLEMQLDTKISEQQLFAPYAEPSMLHLSLEQVGNVIVPRLRILLAIPTSA